MSLDPVFEPLRKIPPPDFGNIPAARKQMATMQSLVPLRTSETVSYSDREIEGRGGSIAVRVYDPASSGKRGALLYFHGGGFMVGNLDTEHSQCVSHAERAGCVVVSVDYRLAPEHPFPAAHDDAWSALQWLVANAESLRVDPKRIAVGGGSAGATIAAGLALRARDEGGPSIRFVLLVQPSTDHLQKYKSAQTPADTPFMKSTHLPEIWRTYFGATPPTGKQLSYAAPEAAETLRGFPATCLFIGDVDPLRDEGLAFGTRLIADGTEVEIHLLAGAPHGFDLVEHAPITEVMRDVQAMALVRALSPDTPWRRQLTAARSAARFGGPIVGGLLRRVLSWPVRQLKALFGA